MFSRKGFIKPKGVLSMKKRSVILRYSSIITFIVKAQWLKKPCALPAFDEGAG